MNNCVLLIQNEMRLRLMLDNLVVECNGKKFKYSIKNIESIVLDNMNSEITGRLLAKLGEENVPLIATDKKHLPIGMYYSYSKHCRSSKILLAQIEHMNKNATLWKKIIVAKIMNQAKTLELLGFSENVVFEIRKLASEVEDGDATNRESFAAKVYFNTLMNTTFSRGNDEILLNGALDYGYAIIRSSITKYAIAYGLNLQLGIHHRNEYNDYNLADDLIEPFRAIIDLYIYKLMEGEEFFSKNHRYDIIDILTKKISYDGRSLDFGDALNEFVRDYSMLIRGENVKLVMPATENVEYAKKDYVWTHYINENIFAEVEKDEI